MTRTIRTRHSTSVPTYSIEQTTERRRTTALALAFVPCPLPRLHHEFNVRPGHFDISHNIQSGPIVIRLLLAADGRLVATGRIRASIFDQHTRPQRINIVEQHRNGPFIISIAT